MTMQKTMQKTIRQNKRESGMALMLSILLLIAVTGLALSTMQTAASDTTVAGFQNQEQIAFYAAEAGVADARAVIRGMGERSQLPTFPADFPDLANPQALSVPGEFAMSGGTQPTYYADPNPPTGGQTGLPIEYLDEGVQCTEGCNMTLQGQKYNHTKWIVNVVGQAPSGDLKRLEVVATRLLAVGY